MICVFSEMLTEPGRSEPMKALVKRFLDTEESYTLLISRIALGVVFFPHGAQKLFGIWGGYGFDATMAGFSKGGYPGIIAFLVIMGESLGAAALVLGFFGRFMAFGIITIMLGAIIIHIPNGFFMDWYAKGTGHGIEYHLLALGLGISIMIGGSGSWSVDRFFRKRIL